jgi:hypothetical protein
MTPAEHKLENPFKALVLGLLPVAPPIIGLRDAETEAEALRDDDSAFADLLDRVLDGRPDHAEWLLIVDQFEELFTSVPDDELADAFLARLLAALDLPRFRVVATVRSDFLDACIAHPGLRAEMNRDGGQYHVDAPDAGALRAMITGPLRERVLLPEKRADIDEDLVKRLVADADRRAGGLALLAFALKDLYDECLTAFREGRRRAPRLCLADYLVEPAAAEADAPDAGGSRAAAPTGLERIIRYRAEKAAADSGVNTAVVLPCVFSRLLTVQADGAATRLREDLGHWAEGSDELRLIEALSAPAVRLVVTGARQSEATAGDEQRAGRVVEVAHEALFRAWPALADWIERRKEALIRRPHTLRDAERWHAAGRPDKGIPTHMLDELRRLFDEAGLWADMVEDEPAVAHYLAREDAAELTALTLAAHAAQAQNSAARGYLLHTLTRFGRKAETLCAAVRQLREHDAAHGTDRAAWLRAGIDIDALFAGPDAERWHWHRVAVGDLLDALGDDREGIGVDADGLPKIAWCDVPPGRFIWQHGEKRKTGAFLIARYPITNAQYRAFVRADD